jgi:RimJ/RimL family protein N-acetyltransferase
MGFHLRPAFWGQGFGTEAARAVLAHAFGTLRVTALFAGHHPDNNESRRLLARLGFRSIGTELYPPTGLLHPSYLLDRADWAREP